MPWYVKDWLASEDRARMTYEARGVYRDLLDYSWLHRGIPSDHGVVANWLGINRHKFALLWSMMAVCWYLEGDRFLNAKQERVRADLEAYRERKREAGRLGGRPKIESRTKADVNQTESTEQTKQKPAFAFPSSKRDTTLIKPRNFNAAFEHPRFDVPQVWHDQRVSGLSDGDAGMSKFYLHLSAHIDAHPEEDCHPIFDWLTGHFNAWIKARRANSGPSEVDSVEETRRKIAAMMSRRGTP